MRIPRGKLPFIFFRLTGEPGSGDILYESGKNENAKVYFASVVTRLHALAIQEFWAGENMPEPKLPLASETDGAASCQSPRSSSVNRVTAVNLKIIRPKKACLIYRNWGSDQHCTWTGMPDSQLSAVHQRTQEWMTPRLEETPEVSA